MKITIFAGDIADAPADAICTSTNPRLSLMMGTGGSIRERGGFEILRACEAIVANAGKRNLPVGSVYITRAGTLAAKRVIHCVASDAAHRTSDAIVKACVEHALLAADSERCHTVAMPVFASGHAGMSFHRAAHIMASAIRESATNVERVFIVTRTPELAEAAQEILLKVMPLCGAEVVVSSAAVEEPAGMWTAQ